MGTGASCASELDVIEEDGAASTGCNASVKLDAALSTSGSLGNGAASTASSPITNYEVLRKIGRGSYGTVFLVRDQRDGLYYCAKQVMLELGSEEERRAAELEVATLAKLDHPSVVAYHEHFLYEDAAAGQSLCLVMAYCEGGDLARLIKTHAEKVPMAYFGEPQILTWFVQMSMALHYVHSKGILHRDLKSQNIFLSHGHAKLGDFGIVKVLDGSVTSAHTVIGTPYYLSPEVCKAQKYSYMSDVWSLGCVLYELCALQQAWTGNNLLAVVYKIVQASHP